MINANILRKIAREKDIPAAVAEKDYALTWLLHGLYNSPLSGKLAFMGGTAIRKVYFPETWRYSEDLDFAHPEKTTPENVRNSIDAALTKASEDSGLRYSVGSYHPTEGHITSRIKYSGPLGAANNIKLDIHLREKLVNQPVEAILHTGYPDIMDFKILAYPLEEILAEKIRSIMQRGKSRDYYDVWRLLKEREFDNARMMELVKRKCEINSIPYTPENMFDTPRLKEAGEHWNKALKHLTKKLPEFNTVVEELQTKLKH